MINHNFKIETYNSIIMAGHAELIAVIQLWVKSDAIGHLNFYKEGVAIPNNSFNVFPYLNFSYHEYGYIIDLLRNEGPVYIIYNEHSNLGQITSLKEPVAEGE